MENLLACTPKLTLVSHALYGNVICNIKLRRKLMKSNKSYLVIIPAIASASFILSQWVMKPNNADAFFSLSSDALGGIVVGIGFGLIAIFLKKGLLKRKAPCD